MVFLFLITFFIIQLFCFILFNCEYSFDFSFKTRNRKELVDKNKCIMHAIYLYSVLQTLPSALNAETRETQRLGDFDRKKDIFSRCLIKY